MENKQEFFSVALKHFVLYSIYAELIEFCNGLLNTLNLKHLASVSPRALHCLLAAENAKPLTAERLQDLFVPEFSDRGVALMPEKMRRPSFITGSLSSKKSQVSNR